METKEEKKKTLSGKKIALIVLVVCIAVAAVYLAVTSGGDQANGNETAESVPVGYELDTPLGELYYPEEWTEYISVKENIKDDTYAADFYAKTEKAEVYLFSLYVGEAGQGYLMGNLKEQPVWIDVAPVEQNDTISDEDYQRATEMQNRVNDIMDQIYHLEGFVKSQPET